MSNEIASTACAGSGSCAPDPRGTPLRDRIERERRTEGDSDPASTTRLG